MNIAYQALYAIGDKVINEFWLEIKDLWAETRGDQRVCVALLDGPVDQSHPSLRQAHLNLLDSSLSTTAGNDFASEHGTQMASIIFGQHDGPMSGIAPDCQGLLVPIYHNNIRGELPICSQARLATAVNRAAQAGANIINISAGQFSPYLAIDPSLEQAIRDCARAGILVVSAAGNHGCERLQIPSSMSSVLAVGALNGIGAMLETSNWSNSDNDHLIFAPGEAIIGALPRAGISAGNGTSYAAAIVSGVAALLLSLQLKFGHTLNAGLVQEVLLSSSQKIEDGRTYAKSSNRIHVRAAVHLLKEKLGIASRINPATPAWEPVASPYWPEESAPAQQEYVINPKALAEKYRDAHPEKFGTVDIMLPGGHSYNVRDLHYELGQGQMGMRFVPVSDEETVTLPDETSAAGSTIIDSYLRHEMRLRPEDPIYALLNWIRPDEHSMDLYQLPLSRKIRMSHEHFADYLGEGRTSHVLPRKSHWKAKSPLDHKWYVSRHPVNVHIISLHGVPQPILNRNAHIVDTILATAGRSPEGTEKVSCRTIDINTTLQFYRDTIRQEEYLQELSWYTNCAVHKTVVINVLLNVPHNERSFQEIFGQDGASLYS